MIPYKNNNFIKHYVNINSSYRNKNPIPQTSNVHWVTLQKNPLKFNFDSNILEIIYPNNFHNIIKLKDKIMICGVQPIKKTLRTVFGNNQNLLEFKNNSKYLKINYKHLLKFPNSNDYDKFDFIENYDTSNLEIELSGIQGYMDTHFIGNIPVNTLNGFHNVLLYDPTDTVKNTYSDDSFYIELITKYDSPTNYITSYNIHIIYNYIAGIPINFINAEFPINCHHVKGYHDILDIDKESIKINLFKKSTLFNDNYNQLYNFAGGNTVNIAIVNELTPAYPNPNHYLINLSDTYSQITHIKLISTEFPNTQKNIIDKGINKNNKLYWQNLEDGDIIYSISIDQGFYDHENIKNTLESKISFIKRIFVRNTDKYYNIEYCNNNIIKIFIDNINNSVIFKSYTKAIISKPFIEIQPIDFSLDSLLKCTITICHPDHKLKVEDKILINNSLSHLQIPADVINSEHEIVEVVDSNHYKIIIKNFNLTDKVLDTKGGHCVNILSPNIFRLRFDFNDTIGDLLGFKLSGSENAITKYNHIITNKDQYYRDSYLNHQVVNCPLKFCSNNYILMTCKQINGMLNYGNIKDVFAKILLPNTFLKEKVLLNTFVELPICLKKPIITLNELEFEFYNEEGELYDFDGLDHSFTLEIVTYNDISNR